MSVLKIFSKTKGGKSSSLFIFLVLFFIPVSCAAKRKGEIPPWLTKRISEDSSYIYEIGVCGKTYFLKDAETCARRDGILKLAVRIRSRVEEEIISLTSSASHSSFQNLNIFIPVKVLERIVEGVEVLKFWYDEKGLYSTPFNTYAFLRFPRSCIEELIKEIKMEENIEGSQGKEEASMYDCPYVKGSIFAEKVLTARGMCGKTYFEKDAFMCAMQNALAELARSIITHVKTSFVESSSFISFHAYEVSEILTDAVISGAVVRGSGRDPAGNYFVEVELPEENLINSLNESIKNLESTGRGDLAKALKCVMGR